MHRNICWTRNSHNEKWSITIYKPDGKGGFWYLHASDCVRALNEKKSAICTNIKPRNLKSYKSMIDIKVDTTSREDDDWKCIDEWWKDDSIPVAEGVDTTRRDDGSWGYATASY